MSVHVLLLRAINVGGRNKIPMAELRQLLSELGCGDVSTYLQSGNVVCTSNLDALGLAASTRDAIATGFGHDVEVLVRSATELIQLRVDFPYTAADPKQAGVVFLAGAVDRVLDADKFAPDECAVSGSHVFVHCPTGFGRTKLTNAWVENQTGLIGTRRNWNTVVALADLAAGPA